MPSTPSGQINVLIVDDSAVIRGLLSKMLTADDSIHIAGSVGDGAQAVKAVTAGGIDVVVLDIEMPVMDGLTALPKILEADKDVKVIMASSLTSRNAQISLQALEMGAADYIAKPSSSREMTGGQQDFARELVSKVTGLAQTSAKVQQRSGGDSPSAAAAKAGPNLFSPDKEIKLVKRLGVAPRPSILAVGSSTGGPQALMKFFTNLDKSVKVPIVVTQHMPPTFTTILAKNLNENSGFPAKEAEDGDTLEPGRIHVAPGDHHMEVVEENGVHKLRLNQNPQENFCRPAVDPMLRSVVKVFGAKVLVVILTGMGFDGQKGSIVVHEAGGTILAQDEESSVVWGMPRAAAEAGVCSAVLSLDELPAKVQSFVARGAL